MKKSKTTEKQKNISKPKTKKQTNKNSNIHKQTDLTVGLTSEQVNERTLAGLTNSSETKTSKSYAKIFFSNIFTFFNIICLSCAIALWCVGSWSDTIFMLIVVANTLISIIQEIKAKKTIDKLTLTNSNFTKVLRDGEELEIYKKEVVVDDILILASGMQIASDSIVVDGTIEVNESLLTGEAQPIRKNVGDSIMAGSFVSSGTCKAQVQKVGSSNYIEKLSSKAKKYSKPKSELLASLTLLIRLIGIIIIPLGILIAYSPIHDSVKTLFWIRKAAKESILHEIVHDFYHAIPFDDDRLRLGDKYLFGHRGSMLPLTYGEINGLFIHAEYQNSIDPRRYLFVQTNSSDSSRFCEIYGDGWTDEELDLFLYIIHTKNPRTSWHMKPIASVYPTLLAKKYGLKK